MIMSWRDGCLFPLLRRSSLPWTLAPRHVIARPKCPATPHPVVPADAQLAFRLGVGGDMDRLHLGRDGAGVGQALHRREIELGNRHDDDVL